MVEKGFVYVTMAGLKAVLECYPMFNQITFDRKADYWRR